MKTMSAVAESMKSFEPLVDWGILTADQLRSAGEAAQARDVEVEEILRYELRHSTPQTARSPCPALPLRVGGVR